MLAQLYSGLQPLILDDFEDQAALGNRIEGTSVLAQ
jgi:hypothetical protein